MSTTVSSESSTVSDSGVSTSSENETSHSLTLSQLIGSSTDGVPTTISGVTLATESSLAINTETFSTVNEMHTSVIQSFSI